MSPLALSVWLWPGNSATVKVWAASPPFWPSTMPLPGCSGLLTSASPDGTMTIEIEGHHVGVGSFASARILVIA